MLKKYLQFLSSMRHARVGTLEDVEVQDMALGPSKAASRTGRIQLPPIRRLIVGPYGRTALVSDALTQRGQCAELDKLCPKLRKVLMLANS